VLSLCLIKEPVGNKLERCSFLESSHVQALVRMRQAAKDSPLDLYFNA
jgi:hypothetical protein